MASRKMIRIDEEKCTGCGLCIPNCPEGALKVVDGKARLISDLFCDGLGACIGHCPEGAITVEEREAEPYDERKVMENIVRQGGNVIREHLEHLKAHGEEGCLNEALDYLKERGVEASISHEPSGKPAPCACPGARTVDFSPDKEDGPSPSGDAPSRLGQWPVQLHLVPPNAPYFKGADLVFSADCAAYSLGSFHEKYLKGRRLAIACPKLDSGQDVYVEKLKSMIDNAGINTLTVLTMEVPCCGGLLHLARKAASESDRKIPIKSVVVGIRGDVIKEEWV